MEGIINLDKPAGLSSARAVARVKRLLPRGVKVGHAGTLDPFATGVLLVLVGKATRKCETLMGQAKRYETVVKLGASTETDDPESPEIVTPDAPRPGVEQIRAELKNFIGEVMQRPPAFSAMKVGGRRAYQLARAGQQVKLQPRPVRVDAIELVNFEWPLLTLNIECGRGTYIRSIARDLGDVLKTGGYLIQLRRTRIGAFDISAAVTLERLMEEGVEKYLTPPPRIQTTF
jgi:tRNA pseudouridine55 synthase